MSNVFDRLAELRIVPALTAADADEAERACRALVAGGVSARDHLPHAVAPGTNHLVVEAARQAGVPFVPGAPTPTEIERARALGCRVVKVFPASLVGGPAFLKAVAAVYRDVRFIPTGGVNAENLISYLEVPSVLACAGTWICEPALVGGGRFDEVERRAREAVAQADVAAAV